MASAVSPSGGEGAPGLDKPGVTGTAWIFEGEMAIDEWLNHGRRLGAIGRGVAWWIGDWLRFGNERYGERYVRAARITRYDTQSLMNMVYVASRFEPARRREGLSWSHHAELAAFDPDIQDYWLDLAEHEHLSVHSLRLEVRTARRVTHSHVDGSPTAEAAETDDPDRSPTITCPKCRYVIDVVDDYDLGVAST